MEKIINVDGCYFQCPFFQIAPDGMDCGHPYWESKEAYDSMIIDQDNSRDGKIPPLCPLRQENLTIKYQLQLKKP